MSFTLCTSATGGTYTSLQNTSRLKVVYELNTPYVYNIGEEVALSDLVNIVDTVTISAKTNEGTVNICSNFPLLYFAAIHSALKGMNYTKTVSNDVEVDAPAKGKVTHVTFYINVVDVRGQLTRLFAKNESLSISLNTLTKGKVSIDVLSTPDAYLIPFIEYEKGAILNGTNAAVPASPCIGFPINATFSKVNAFGTVGSDMDADDLLSAYEDDFISPLQQGINANFAICNLSGYVSPTAYSGTGELLYFYVKP